MTKRICLVVLSVLFALAAIACAKPEAAPTVTPEVTPVSIEAQPEAAEAPMTNDGLGIKILLEQDDSMINNYSVLAVNDAASFKDADGNAVSGVAINTVGAKALIDWLMSDEAAQLIAGYGMEAYGESLFTLKTDKPVSTAVQTALNAKQSLNLIDTVTGTVYRLSIDNGVLQLEEQ